MRRIVLCFATLAAGIAVGPRPASAAVTDFYSSIEFVEVIRRDPVNNLYAVLAVRGVLVGTTVAVTRNYTFPPQSGVHLEGFHTAFYCMQLATTVMLHPTELQFSIGANVATAQGGCRVTTI